MRDTKLKVFFGCSMRGGHNFVSEEDLRKLPEIIEKTGCELISKHQTEKGIIEKENKLTPEEIHDRDYNWLKMADFGIFEISNPSLGVGAEISDMTKEGKPVLCLFQGDENLISAYIRGKQNSKFISTNVESHAYSELSELRNIIEGFIRTYL